MRVLADKWKTIDQLAFGPGTRLAVAYSSGLIVWDAATGEQTARFRYSSDPPVITGASGILSPPDGQAVYLVSAHFGLCEFRLPDLKLIPLDQPQNPYLHSAAMSPDGRRVVCCTWWHGGWREIGSNRALIGYERNAQGYAGFAFHAHIGQAYCPALSFLHDGDHFAAVEGCPIPGRPLQDRERSYQITIHQWPGAGTTGLASGLAGSVEQLVASPSGEWLVGRAKNALLFWPSSLTDSPGRVANDNRKHFTGVAFHPSGRFLAATSNDATVKLYDTDSWQVAKTFTWSVGKLRSVAFSPDGTLAAVGSDTGKIVVWDVDL